MAAYDNLLANVPTDLWIGGKWRKASDNARFISVVMTATAMPLATSPALYPPMPSASTTSPTPGSLPMLSSL